MDITPLRIHSSLVNCFNKVVFLRFYNELTFYVLSRDGKMLGLSPGIKISVSSKSGHSTFVLSTVDDNWLLLTFLLTENHRSLIQICITPSLESTSWFIPSASPVTSRLTSSFTCQLISVIITNLIIHHSFTPGSKPTFSTHPSHVNTSTPGLRRCAI